MLLALACWTLAAAVPAAEGFQPPFYFAKDIRATVVDETSGHPVPDVVVVALWELRQVSARPRLHVAETLTDAEGRFHVPGWGPKLRPPLAELGDRSPLLLLFKRGFVPLRLHNESRARVEQLVPNYRTLPTRQLREMIAWHRGDNTYWVANSLLRVLTNDQMVGLARSAKVKIPNPKSKRRRGQR